MPPQQMTRTRIGSENHEMPPKYAKKITLVNIIDVCAQEKIRNIPYIGIKICHFCVFGSKYVQAGSIRTGLQEGTGGKVIPPVVFMLNKCGLLRCAAGGDQIQKGDEATWRSIPAYR
jgi:hypothetical protein